MKKEFENRVIQEFIVDTKRYRYMHDEMTNEIKRLPIKYLDTTSAIDGWETVKTF